MNYQVVRAVGELKTQGISALILVTHSIEVQQLEENIAVSVTVYMTPVVADGTVGRQQYLIPQDIVGLLLETGFSSLKLLAYFLSPFELYGGE